MKAIPCVVCGGGLKVTISTSRKAKRKKTFVMLVCPIDGRHFRAFIGDQEYVRRLVDQQAEKVMDQPTTEPVAKTG